MAVQAIIMAGGAGTRLRPLTCDMPKPLAPLCGAPVMDYTLRLLKRHGFADARATLWYRPRDIMNVFGQGRHGVSLSYAVEEAPVGTAGSVLLAAGAPRDTLLVLSGDGLTGADLTAALAFHRQRGAAATLVLKRVDIPLPYGVVVASGEGRIQRFIEKPDWSRVISSLVNTGIYLLEPEALGLIPRDRPFDFGRELFPLMLKKGLPLYGFESQGYWCDVGDPAAFLRAQADLLAGRTGFAPADTGLRDTKDALISADSYVAREAQIEKGAVICHSCVLPGACVGAGARLAGAIVCARARVGRGALLQAGAVLGEGASAGDFSRLAQGAQLWPGVRLADQATAEGTVLKTEEITVSSGVARAETPAQLSALGAAFLQAAGGGTINVMHDGAGVAAYHTLLGALSAYGARCVWALGRGTAGMLAHSIDALAAAGGLLCRGQGVLLLDGQGLRLRDQACAAVEGAARRREAPALCGAGPAPRPHVSLRRGYIQAMAQRFACAGGVAVRLVCRDAFLRQLAKDALTQAGHRVEGGGEIGLEIEEKSLRLLLPGGEITPMQQWLLCARALRRRGEGVFDTADYGLEELGLLPCDGSDACLKQQRLLQDGLARALLLMQLFAGESPEQALQALPAAAHRQADIPCTAAEKGRVLERLLAHAHPRDQGGLAARHGDARAVIRPDPVLPLMHVDVAAYSAEYAQEICDFYAGRVRAALHEHL